LVFQANTAQEIENCEQRKRGNQNSPKLPLINFFNPQTIITPLLFQKPLTQVTKVTKVTKVTILTLLNFPSPPLTNSLIFDNFLIQLYFLYKILCKKKVENNDDIGHQIKKRRIKMDIDKIRELLKKVVVSLPAGIPYFGNMYSILFSLSSDKTGDLLRVLEEIRALSKDELNDIKKELQDIGVSSEQKIEQAIALLKIFEESEKQKIILAFRLGIDIGGGVCRISNVYNVCRQFSIPLFSDKKVNVDILEKILFEIRILSDRLGIKLWSDVASVIIDSKDNTDKFVSYIKEQVEIGQPRWIKNFYMAGYNIGIVFDCYFFASLTSSEEFIELINDPINEAQKRLSEIGFPYNFLDSIKDPMIQAVKESFHKPFWERVEHIENQMVTSLDELFHYVTLRLQD